MAIWGKRLEIRLAHMTSFQTEATFSGSVVNGKLPIASKAPPRWKCAMAAESGSRFQWIERSVLLADAQMARRA